MNFSGVVGRSDVCPSCGADVRCCKNCQWYEPGSHYDCHESIDQQVTDKERSNFCDYFKLNAKAGNTVGKTDKAAEARNAFNALFGD